MPPAMTAQSGQAMGTPDTCLTPAPPAPPIPTPYPNIVMVNQATGTCSNVKASGSPVVTTSSEVPMSSGDEAGNSPGGVVSGQFKGKCKFMRGAMKVKAGGKPVVPMGGTTGHNGASSNMPAGSIVAPSQTKVIVN